jgi:D-glycero-D-manno-heptose 1,7-bisphosphate phosphatase
MSFIILDRDGVINFDSEEYIKSADEWIAIPGSLEAIAHLNRAGFRVLVVTNQSGISRGYFNFEILTEMHNKFIQELAAVGGYVEEIFFCPHQPSDNCECRKPRPGLLREIEKKYKIDWSMTYLIGDNLSDIQLANTVGCKPILVLTGKGQRMLDTNPELESILHFKDLAEAARFIINT